MKNTNVTKARVAAAIAIAVLTDGIELPLNLAFFSGLLAAPAELLIVAFDICAMTLLTWLLGFHWPLVAALGLEVIPGADVIPTWTGCVTFILWKRNKTGKQTDSRKPAKGVIIDISPG